MAYPATDVDMAALRAAYEGGEWPLKAIYREFHISDERMRRLALEGGWRHPDMRIKADVPEARKAKRSSAQPARPRMSDADRDALRRAYEGSEEPVEVACARLGFSSGTVFRLASRNNWIRDQRAYRKDAMTRPAKPRTTEDQSALISRLYDILGAQIRALAIRETESGAAESDPDTADTSPRQLEQLIKCLKTLHDLTEALGGAGPRDAGDGRTADEIRISIRLRLDQRLAASRAGGVSEPARGSD